MIGHIRHWLHRLLYTHVYAEKPGMGTFAFCIPRIGPVRGARFSYRPDPTVDIWHQVPSVRYPDGTFLTERMLAADNAAAAMALLNDAQSGTTPV